MVSRNGLLINNWDYNNWDSNCISVKVLPGLQLELPLRVDEGLLLLLFAPEKKRFRNAKNLELNYNKTLLLHTSKVIVSLLCKFWS